jgi:hypothetical protein
MARAKPPKFTSGQEVTLCFTDGNRIPAVVFENIDHQCSPLTDMWSVRILVEGGLGRAFGFTGKAIEPRAPADLAHEALQTLAYGSEASDEVAEAAYDALDAMWKARVA